MATPKLKVEPRILNPKVKPHILRKRGFLPGVLYGRNKDTREFQIRTKELQSIISKHGYGAMVNLEIENKLIPAIIKEVQKETLSQEILNIDLQELSHDVKIKLIIPIVLEDKDRVENSNTIVEQQLKELNIQCFPKYITSSIIVNSSVLEDSNVLKVGDLEVINNKNIEVLNDVEEIVATLSRATKEIVEEEDNSPIYASDKSILD